MTWFPSQKKIHVTIYLDENSRVCEGIIKHGQHVGRRDDSGVVTPGGDQQPVVDLNKEKNASREDSSKAANNWNISIVL